MSKKEAKDITAYRPCVGVMLINKDGLVWIGRRFEKQNDDGVGKWWQMPQGGIDEGEDPAKAALRELVEETGITSVTPLGATADSLRLSIARTRPPM